MRMTEAFYIVQPKKDWYRLHVTTTHYCLGGGEHIETLLNTVERLTRECRNEQGLLKRLSETEDKGRVTEKTLEVYGRDYEDLPHFTEEVRKCVEKTLEDMRLNTAFNRNRRKSAFARHNSEVTAPPVEDKDTTPTPLLKRRVFKSRHGA